MPVSTWSCCADAMTRPVTWYRPPSTTPSSMLATKTSPFTGVCSSIASSLCYLHAFFGVLTPLWSHKILRGGFAVLSVGDGCCELVEFMHLEDAASQHLYFNESDTNYAAY